MKGKLLLGILLSGLMICCFAFMDSSDPEGYAVGYKDRLNSAAQANTQLLRLAEKSDPGDSVSREVLRAQIRVARRKMKAVDIWTRYLDPVAYKSLNGPLPVEWETEVFEKFEKPYRRIGGGLTLAALELDEDQPRKDSLLVYLRRADSALNNCYLRDTITRELSSYHHFMLSNRLHLLNLAAIYTTGFDCPDTSEIIPELRAMMHDTYDIYELYNRSFPNTALNAAYMRLYDSAIAFAEHQPDNYTSFNHFAFIRDFVNPLYRMNAGMVREYNVVSHNLVDFALNKNADDIFSKELYRGQNAKGIFLRVRDSATLASIAELGRLLFYDPILSGNNQRSCASCHKPTQAFADTLMAASLRFDRGGRLARNTPSLINAEFNHLLMTDGKHFSLQHQATGVITNAPEMGGTEAEILRKIQSCRTYKNGFNALLEYTPQTPELSMEHIASAITFYYCSFSKGRTPFDDAVLESKELDSQAIAGFNLFMGRAQCATCHFVPQFNGVKPPYAGSEFEVLGVPADTGFKRLSADSGRACINPAAEMLHAFRTGTVRNAMRTAPYMHNGVFRSMDEVLEFYNRGGGAGRGMDVPNQTLSADPLGLSVAQKEQLKAFIRSLNEPQPIATLPEQLPKSSMSALNRRKPGGSY
jgi:cytochrome c peroxidase